MRGRIKTDSSISSFGAWVGGGDSVSGLSCHLPMWQLIVKVRKLTLQAVSLSQVHSKALSVALAILYSYFKRGSTLFKLG